MIAITTNNSISVNPRDRRTDIHLRSIKNPSTETLGTLQLVPLRSTLTAKSSVEQPSEASATRYIPPTRSVIQYQGMTKNGKTEKNQFLSEKRVEMRQRSEITSVNSPNQ